VTTPRFADLAALYDRFAGRFVLTPGNERTEPHRGARWVERAVHRELLL
jgi:hypothetical protein